MNKLSITTAWNESSEFLKRHFGALFIVALALIALPSVAMQALGPAASSPGEVPAPGLWLLLLPVMVVLSTVGSLAISSLALGRQNVVGEAIAHGFRRFLPMLGAGLIVVLGWCLILIPLAVLAGLSPSDLDAPSQEKAGRILLVLVVVLVAALFVGARLLLMTPVAAAEPAGPIAIIRRSWTLTAGHFWKLLGFILLMFVAVLVVMFVVMMVFGLIIAFVAGAPEPGSLAGLLVMLVSALLNSAFIVLMTTMVARIYVQLAGDAKSVAAVFE